jgi:hypothetical protein
MEIFPDPPRSTPVATFQKELLYETRRMRILRRTVLYFKFEVVAKVVALGSGWESEPPAVIEVWLADQASVARLSSCASRRMIASLTLPFAEAYSLTPERPSGPPTLLFPSLTLRPPRLSLYWTLPSFSVMP